MSVTSLGIICVLVGVAYGSPSGNIKIVGGHDAVEGQFPYMVSYKIPSYHSCGGTILNNNWTITHSACVIKWIPEGVRTTIGSISRDEGTLLRSSLYEVNGPIALVKFLEPITYNETIQPIELSTEYVEEGVEAVMSGWGDLSHNGAFPKVLQYAQTKTISISECREVLQPNIVAEDEFCTYTRAGEGSCVGDAGNPVVKDNKLIGISSWGIPCVVGWPDVNTRISKYVEWINSVIWSDVRSGHK